MANKVWVLGDAVVDLIPEGSDCYLKCPGGAPANVAVGVARLGGQAAMIGKVGGDPFGRFMRQVLQQEGVDTGYMVLDPAQRTSTVLVDLDDEGERSFTFMVRPSADQFLTQDELPTFAAGEWLLTCSIALANEPVRSTTLAAMQAMRAAGGNVCFDPNLRPDVWANPDEQLPVVRQALALADVVKFSEEELLYLTGTDDLDSGLEALKEFDLKLALITQGAAGVLVYQQAERWQVPACRVSPVDTTGAGDAFVCGLLAGLSATSAWPDQQQLNAILRQANACGALATTAKGAMTALPNQQQLEQFLKEQGM